MRARRCVIGAGLFLLAGCGSATEARPEAMRVPVPPVVDLPASAAGGVCRLLDFDTVEKATGTRFDVSAASRHRTTDTCVLRAEQTERPDLVLSVTKTSADTEVFTEEMVPSGGRQVKELGKAAYQRVVPPTRTTGAAVDLGWLTGKGQLVNLRFTLAKGQDKAAAEALLGSLVGLAKELPVGR